MEQKRYGERLAAICDASTTSFVLPVLTLQPVAENAVKHGTAERENGGRLQCIGTFRVCECDGTLAIESTPGSGNDGVYLDTEGGAAKMTILTADDEPFALESTNQAVREALPDAEIRSFTRSSEALREITENGYRPDIAFLDIKMPGISGLEMAKRIREASPCTNVVFVTAYSDYALDALALHPSGYLMKPATADKVQAELDNLRFPLVHEKKQRLRVQCFGNFEVFADGKPVTYTYQKSKELLAYLVDRRGAACNTAELCAVLWEDRPDSPEQRKYLRRLLSDLAHSLAAVGAEDVLIKRRNSFAVAADGFDCDYYQMLAGNIAAINTYTGEYMTQYSWAEMTLGSIEGKL